MFQTIARATKKSVPACLIFFSVGILVATLRICLQISNVARASPRALFSYLMTTSQPRSVYEALKKTTDPDIGVTHLRAHAFGDALYKARGIAGISVCDGSFGFGCYHGLISQAIAKEGEGVVAALSTLCVEQYGINGTGCQHGIGHGLAEYFGPKQLNKQLDNCKNLPWLGVYFGCQNGVFMEFFHPVINDERGNNFSSRTIDQSNPYGPCTLVDNFFRDACYLELGSWWYKGDDQALPSMFDWCDAADTKQHVHSCLLGIGIAIAQKEQLSSLTSTKKCLTGHSTLDRGMCLAGARWIIFSEPEYRKQSEEVCQSVPKPEQEICEERWFLIKYVK